MRRWSRSKYEKTIHRMIAREPMRVGRKQYRVNRMNGWYQVEFREVGTKRCRTFNLDELVQLSAAKKLAPSVPSKRKAAKNRRAK